MYFNDAFYERQSYAGAFAFGVEFIEKAKNLLVKSPVDPNSVIPYKEYLLTLFLAHTDLDARLGWIAHEFCRIIYQVLHHFHQPWMIPIYDWEVFVNIQVNIPCHQSPAG